MAHVLLIMEGKRPPDIPRKKLVVLFDGINTWDKELKWGIERIVDELTSLVKLGHEVMVLQLSKKRGVEILQPFTTDEGHIRNAVSKASGSVWKAGWDLAGVEIRRAEINGAQMEAALRDRIETQLKEYLFTEKRKFEETMAGILATLNMMKSLPGRKSILFISSGIPEISTVRWVSTGEIEDKGIMVKVNPLFFRFYNFKYKKRKKVFFSFSERWKPGIRSNKVFPRSNKPILTMAGCFYLYADLSSSGKE